MLFDVILAQNQTTHSLSSSGPIYVVPGLPLGLCLGKTYVLTPRIVRNTLISPRASTIKTKPPHEI